MSDEDDEEMTVIEDKHQSDPIILDEKDRILSEETKFKMKPAICPVSMITCSDKLCPRKITLGDPCYLDLLSGEFLCIHCGKCLRYARKRAVGRGESIESAEV